MRPIRIVCEQVFQQRPEEISGQILELDNWSDFQGYGPLPGIAQAEFEVRTDGVVGTRIQVTNRDGSKHVEEIIEWEPERQLRLEMKEFSPPVSRMATHFEESWEFTTNDSGTQVVRSMALHPKSVLAKPMLWLISSLLKRAIQRHLDQMAEKEQSARQ